MRLQERAETEEVVSPVLEPDDGVRVAHRDGRHLEELAGDVQCLERADVYLSEILLDEPVVTDVREHGARADVHPYVGLPVRRASHAAAMRVPLPDISASEPSGFQISTVTSSSVAERTSRTPSESPAALASRACSGVSGAPLSARSVSR